MSGVDAATTPTISSVTTGRTLSEPPQGVKVAFNSEILHTIDTLTVNCVRPYLSPICFRGSKVLPIIYSSERNYYKRISTEQVHFTIF